MLSKAFTTLFIFLSISASFSFAESVGAFGERMIKEYNRPEQIKTYEPTYIPRKSDIVEDKGLYGKHLLLPSLKDLNQEIENIKFKNVLFPEPGLLKDDFVTLIYIRIIEKSIPASKMDREMFRKLLKYKEGLLTPEGKLYLAVIDYVDQDKNSFQEYEFGAVYLFLPLKTLLTYHLKGARADIVFPLITESYDKWSLIFPIGFERSFTGEDILKLMAGHSEQKRFAAKYMDILTNLGSCKPNPEFDHCKSDGKFLEKAKELQKVYGPINVRDYSNELCPCPGE
jgi:hypothetical protein